MTLQTWPVRLLSLISIVVPMTAQESYLITPSHDSPIAPAPFVNKANLVTGDRNPASGVALYRWSVATVLAANTLDVASSWRNREANPFVAGPTTQFGVTSMAIKSGFVGASLLMQHFVLRHHPEAAKRMAWMNFVTSGVLGGVAAHNMSLR
jgi:hypothetical protein